jgi:hypothetical protein
MHREPRSGRLVGLLLLLQLVGLILPFVMLLPITPSTFLVDTANSALQIRLAVLMLFVNGAVTIGIALAAFPTLRQHSERFALSLLAVSIIWFVAQGIDNAQILAMLALSGQYAAGDTATPQILDALAIGAYATRRATHYTALLVIDAWIFLFYLALTRFALVPRALGLFGLAMVIVHVLAVPLPMFLAYQSSPSLAVSLAFSHPLFGVWLMVKGFRLATPGFPGPEARRSSDSAS